ncbi:MAG: hypothetical protein HDT15_03245 [Oscillibacter sp.]|nr:hypothetical protein [Oscillibacter sp.]
MTVNVLEWVLSASALIVVVMFLRGLLGKRISAGLRYGLWAVVLVRLLVPVSFFSLPVEVPQIPAWTPSEAMQEENIYVLPVDIRPVEDSGVHVFEDGSLGDPSSFGYPKLSDDGETVVRYANKISPLELLKWVWIAGTAAMGIVLATFNLRFSRRLRRVRQPLEGTNTPIPVYMAPALPSPCLVGVLFPAVYVTEEAAADTTMLRHVLAHELTHYNHRDHLWSVLRGAALAVHWWNPMVWLAVVCSRRDGELACDEGALKKLGDSERTAYGETLLTLVTAKARPTDLLSFATTMTGGKRSLKERIQRIAHQPKRLVSAMVIVITVLSLSALVAFGQAKEDPDVPPAPTEDGERLGDAWKTAEITVDEEGVPHIRYIFSDGSDVTWNGTPIPAPREWANDDLAGRNEAAALIVGEEGPEIWAKMVSPTEGWLVACYGRGVAIADTYVYKTSDRGMSWTEVTMPGTSWHIADVGFLSPERLIVAQRLFDGAPCFITKDGGATWEKIELPDKVERFDEEIELPHAVVQEIWFDGGTGTVYMDIGQNESDPMICVMISEDLGDTWTVEPVVFADVADPLRWTPDLDRDGKPDTLILRKSEDAGQVLWTLQVIPRHMSDPIWEDEAITAHVGWKGIFLCQMEGEDYLLEYSPYMGGGNCYYSYKLFYLTADGEEVVVQENSVEFDINFGSAQHQYDPEAINAFMEKINALLANSELLVNTDENLIGTFQKEGRLYDSVWWLDDRRDNSLTLLENLQNYGSYAEDHPDDTWSPLEDLLLELTEEDIPMFNGDTTELVRLLRSAERGSRFYTWGSEAAAYIGHGAEEVDYTIWNLPLVNGNTLWLLACEERSSVLMIYETPEEAISAFYTAPELKKLIQGEEEFPPAQTNTALERSESVQNKEESSDSQAEQYYEAGSLPLFQVAFSRLDKEAQGKWLEKIYADGDIAFFSVAVRGLGTNSSLIADIAEKVYSDKNIAFFSTLADYMDEAELELWLERALEDGNWTFQSVLFNKLDRNDEFDDLKEENEKRWAEAQTAEYRAAGVTWEGKSCYYQGQLVNIFLDVRANKSFYTLDMNPAGTVNIKIIRNENNEITGVDYMTDAEVEDLLKDMG